MNRYHIWTALIFILCVSNARADVLARWDFRHWEQEAGFPIMADGGTQAGSAKLGTTFHAEGVAKSGKESLRLNRGIPGKAKANERAVLELTFTLPENGPLYLFYRIQRSQSGFLNQEWSYATSAGRWTAFPGEAGGEISAEKRLCKMDLSRLVEENGGQEISLRVAFSGGVGGGGSNVLIDLIEIATSEESFEGGAASNANGAAPSEVALGIRGIGGVYFMAEQGELVVEVKRRNGAGRMQVILTSPDREEIDIVELEEGEGAEELKGSTWSKKRLTANVDLPGVYRLEVFSPGDREGRGLVWSFATNAKQYMIDSSISQGRIGSKLPVSLDHAGHSAAFVFRAPARQFDVAISGLPREVKSVEIEAADEAFRLPVAKGAVKERLSADERGLRDLQGKLIVLRWSSQKGKVAIEGLTHWDGPRDGYYPNLPLWTDSPAAFFDIDYHRWALFPYNAARFTPPGEGGEVYYTIRNGSPDRAVFFLTLHGGDLGKWGAVLDKERVALGPGESTSVKISYQTPLNDGEASLSCRLALKVETGHGEFQTYSSLHVNAPPPRKEAVAPIVLSPYQHEIRLYGYLPDYPLNEVAFDLSNRPMIRERDADGEQSQGVFRWSDESWKLQPFSQSETLLNRATSGAGARLPTKIAFDESNQAYTLLAYKSNGGGTIESFLVAMPDAESVVAYPLEGGKTVSFEMEQFTGHNSLAGPPPLLSSSLTEKEDTARWKYIYRMELILPRKSNEGIVFDERVEVSQQTIGISGHSGGSAQLASDGNLVHIVWGEVSPDGAHDPGVPTYAATYDRSTRILGEKVLVGYGPPKNDIHNFPAIVMDSEGYLHVLTGAHGRSFQYARSLKPHSTADGWTKPIDVVVDSKGQRGGGTYIGLVCGPDDTLHLVYRQNRSGDVEHFQGAKYHALSYQRKKKGQKWEEPKPLVVPPLPDYSVYYHRLSLDRRGNLFVSYSYRSAYRTYRSDTPGFITHPALLTSSDSGETWRLASNQDLVGEAELTAKTEGK